MENVECVERSGKSSVESRVVCERRFELRSQDGNLGNVINVGLRVGVGWWGIDDGLDRFVGSPEFLNPVAPWNTGKTQRVFDKTANRNRK